MGKNNLNWLLTEEKFGIWKKNLQDGIERLKAPRLKDDDCVVVLSNGTLYLPQINVLLNDIRKNKPQSDDIYYSYPQRINDLIDGLASACPSKSEAIYLWGKFEKELKSYFPKCAITYRIENTHFAMDCDGNRKNFNVISHMPSFYIPVVHVPNIGALCMLKNIGFILADDNDKEMVKTLRELFKKGIVTCVGYEISLRDLSYAEFCELVNNGGLDLKSMMILSKEELLNRDNVRCGLTPYDSSILTDSCRGHWELWDPERCDGDIEMIKYGEDVLYARNPACDINRNSIVAIDFGTKSTVAVILDEESNYRPIRIGSGDFSKVSDNQFENPTVIQFLNFSQFIREYRNSNGRPRTKFNDICVSHNAYNSLKGAANSGYKHFVSKIKQYAGGGFGLRKSDNQNEDIKIKPYFELTEDDVDVIEIYAYYIGLYINNMYRKIFMNYLLSMPVNFEEAVRTRIVKSFERGIKKSFPEALCNNISEMEKFSIAASSNESAAYAVTALTQFGFDPDEDEKVFYGVFDFGGGTTDFDFGFWRGATSKERRYDYVITYYDDEGDVSLGGENILDILAYTVWCDNIDVMREKNIPINIPTDCSIIPNCELLICSDNKSGVRSPSDESSFNSWKLAEDLRWIWEDGKPEEAFFSADSKNENANDDVDNNLSENPENSHASTYTYSADLYNLSGETDNKLKLRIDYNHLRSVIEKRIERGVSNFFDCLRKNARRFIDEEQATDIKINIFLAGNSCKSSIVEKLFDKYIENELGQIKDSKDKKDYFNLFYPLGTEKANEQIVERGVQIDTDEVQPNCKTGVAYGLLLSRNGGKIKVVDNRKVSTIFDYYIGYEKKNKFIHITDKAISYDKWYEFIDASVSKFELYYTTYPEAVGDSMPIDSTKKVVCDIDVIDENAYVYYRAISSNQIEYVVAAHCSDGQINEKDYLTKPVVKTLG